MAKADHREDSRTIGADPVLLRSTAWGTAAALALGAFAFAAQSESGSERLQFALYGTPPVRPTVATAAPDPGLKALHATLDRLLSERERIDARLASLEQGLQDVTGSVRRQAEKREPAAPPIIEPPVMPPMATLTTPVPTESPPRPASPTETPAKLAPSAEPAASTDLTAPAEAAPVAPSPIAVPLPRPRLASNKPAAHAEFGVELGVASDLDGLRARWVSIKANFGPLLVGLSPVGVKDRHPGSAKLRLMAGPLPSLAAARELCAKFVAGKGSCLPARVDAADVIQR